MSRIMEHNIHNNTDSLYNPLRNALKKSVLPAQTHYNHKNFTPDKLSNSCITQDFRVLSSAEAENIVIHDLHSGKIPLSQPTKN